MSSWRPRVASLLLLALSGCFVDPGKSSGGGPGSTAEATTSTAESSTTAPTTTGTAGSTGDATQADVTTDAGATGEQCREAFESCADGECCGCLVCVLGSCLPNDGACGGECRTCDTKGECGPSDVGASCAAPGGGNLNCTAKVWGVDEGACHAFDDAVGTCDADQQCVGAACLERGEKIADCPECMLAEHACVRGASVMDVPIAKFCATSGSTPACQSECDGDELIGRSCDARGSCQEVDEDCGDYVCANAACPTSCVDDAGCSGAAKCVDGLCG